MGLRCTSMVVSMLICGYALCHSQVTISGSVDAYPLDSITVTLVDVSTNNSAQTITNFYGIFQFDNIPRGNYYLKFSGRYVNSANSKPFNVGDDGVSGLRYVLTPTTPALISLFHTHAMFSASYFYFPDMVEMNRAWIESDAEFYPCVASLSQSLASHALGMPSFNDAYEHSANIAAHNGLPLDLARSVAEEQTKVAGDMMAMSRTLNELGATTREIMQGNSDYFRNTELFSYAQIFQFALSQMPTIGLNPDAVYAYIFSLMFHMTYAYASMVCE